MKSWGNGEGISGDVFVRVLLVVGYRVADMAGGYVLMEHPAFGASHVLMVPRVRKLSQDQERKLLLRARMTKHQLGRVLNRLECEETIPDLDAP